MAADKKPSAQWNSNSQPLCHKTCALLLCYNQLPNRTDCSRTWVAEVFRMRNKFWLAHVQRQGIYLSAVVVHITSRQSGQWQLGRRRLAEAGGQLGRANWKAESASTSTHIYCFCNSPPVKIKVKLGEQEIGARDRSNQPKSTCKCELQVFIVFL